MGGKSWTAEEDRLVHSHYPNYAAMTHALPLRSVCAVKNRAKTLDVAQPQHAFTGVEAKRFRSLCEAGLTWAELGVAFPHRSIDVLKYFAHANQIAYLKQYKRAANPCVQAVRERAIAMKIKMAVLDRLAKSGDFYRHGGPYGTLKHIAAGAAVLGGEVKIQWDPLD